MAEWAAFNGDPVDCSVHLVDSEIDTGPIICIREVNHPSTEIDGLRNPVRWEQIRFLGEIVRYTLQTGALPPTREQRPGEGRLQLRHRYVTVTS